MSDDPSTSFGWDLPEDVLYIVLSALPPKSIARSTSVAKPWRDIVMGHPSLNERVALEKAWRSSVVQPTFVDRCDGRDAFERFGVRCIARHGEKLAFGDLKCISVFDLGKKRTVVRMNAFAVDLAFLDESTLFRLDTSRQVLGWNYTISHEPFFCTPFDIDDPSNEPWKITCVGDHIVVGGSAGVIKTWKRGSWGALGQALQGHTKCIVALDSARDGTLLVSAANDWKIIVWDVSQSKRLNVFSALSHNYITMLSVTTDFIAYGSRKDNTIYLVGLESGEAIGMLNRDGGIVEGICAYGTHLVTRHSGKVVNVWDTDVEQECIRTLRVESGAHLAKAWITADSLIVLDCNGRLGSWNFAKASEYVIPRPSRWRRLVGCVRRRRVV